MAFYYLDTSAIVKMYVDESGTDFVAQLINDSQPSDRFYISFLTVLEFTSAIMCKVKGNTLGEEVAAEILSGFDSDTRTVFRIWPLNQELVLKAIPVVEQHKLRTGDAIHLATALDILSVEDSSPDVVMVSSDRELIEASSNSGFLHLDPLDPDAITQLNQMRSIADQADD